MQEKVARAIAEHGLVTPGERVLVAVSGGPDSVALLHLLHDLAPEFSFSLHAAHLDHALRHESAADARFVARLCEDLGVRLTCARRPVSRVPGNGGLEQEARRVRRTFLGETADASGCAHIALGHHRDDQTETFMLRLLRGSGPTGLAAMRPRSGRFVRPLLDLRREEILAYLAARQVEYLEDPSNKDSTLTRNRVRHQLLPQLRGFNPRFDVRVGRLTQRLALEEDFWNRQVDAELPEVMEEPGDGIRLALPVLQQKHPALRDRLLRRALERVRGSLRGIEEVHLDQIIALLETGPVQGEVHLPGLWAGRRYDKLWLRNAAPEAAPAYDLQVGGPGRFTIPGGGRLDISLAECPEGEGRWVKEFDAAATPFPLRIRPFAPGDRLHPEGMSGRKKIKDLLIENRIEKELRGYLPMVLSGGEILWVAGLRRCSGRRPRDGGAKVLRIAAERLAGGG